MFSSTFFILALYSTTIEDTCSGHSKSGDSSCADDLVCGKDNCSSGEGDCCYQPTGLGTEEDPCEGTLFQYVYNFK